MTTRQMATGHEITALQIEDIKKWLAPQASDADVEIFVRFCQGQGLNPFTREVFLISFKDKRASELAHKDVYTSSIVVGLQAYLKRASRNSLYQTYQSGLIVKRGSEYVDVVGTVGYPGDELYGAWCKVWKKGAPVPFEHRITLKDWDKKRELWLTIPGPMLEKTAISQCVRRAIPEEFGPNDLPQEVEGITVEVGEEVIKPSSAARKESPQRAALPATPQQPSDAPEPGGAAAQRPPVAHRCASFEERVQAFYDKARTDLGMDGVAVNTIANKEGVDLSQTSTDLRRFWDVLKARRDG